MDVKDTAKCRVIVPMRGHRYIVKKTLNQWKNILFCTVCMTPWMHVHSHYTQRCEQRPSCNISMHETTKRHLHSINDQRKKKTMVFTDVSTYPRITHPVSTYHVSTYPRITHPVSTYPRITYPRIAYRCILWHSWPVDRSLDGPHKKHHINESENKWQMECTMTFQIFTLNVMINVFLLLLCWAGLRWFMRPGLLISKITLLHQNRPLFVCTGEPLKSSSSRDPISIPLRDTARWTCAFVRFSTAGVCAFVSSHFLSRLFRFTFLFAFLFVSPVKAAWFPLWCFVLTSVL